MLLFYVSQSIELLAHKMCGNFVQIYEMRSKQNLSQVRAEQNINTYDCYSFYTTVSIWLDEKTTLKNAHQITHHKFTKLRVVSVVRFFFNAAKISKKHKDEKH